MHDDDEDLDALNPTPFQELMAVVFTVLMILASIAVVITLVWYFFSSTAGA